MLETTIRTEGMGTPLPYGDNVAMEFSTQTIAECTKVTIKCLHSLEKVSIWTQEWHIL